MTIYLCFRGGVRTKALLSNTNYLCAADLQLTTIDPLLKCDADYNEETPTAYLSPEAYRMVRCGDVWRVSEVSERESSLVFSMGMNWL